MFNESHIEGDSNIIIQGVTDSSITVCVEGKTKEINKKLDVILAWLQDCRATAIQTPIRTYPIDALHGSNLSFILGQVEHQNELPPDLAQNLIAADNTWVGSLKQAILKQGVSVGNTPHRIFEHYGWLIENYLQKMETDIGRARNLRRLSFMTEAFQSSLRYLCFIQVSQILQRGDKPQDTGILNFFQLEGNQHEHFDYMLLLLLATMRLQEEEVFMPELNDFVSELSDIKTDLYSTALFLDVHRIRLLNNLVGEGLAFEEILDEYHTALVFRLRKLAFLAKYRLVSVKDISLHYRMGTIKNFVHIYGELHGMFAEEEEVDYCEHSVREAFTYNQSILLFKGHEVDAGFANINAPNAYLSLSPLVIDHSVYMEKRTQTPEIFYYIGCGNSKRNFRYAMYKNELPLQGAKLAFNKELEVKMQNNHQPKLDELYLHLDQLLKPFL